MKSFIFAAFLPALAWSQVGTPAKVYSEPVTSVLISEDFLNEQIAAHNKSKLLENVKVVLDTKGDQLFLRGILKIPVEEMKAVNLDPKLGAFRFQLAVRPDSTPEGFLILEFPLNETFFYPASSKEPEKERIIVPVQLLSVAMASARGYLSALSGDFSGFDKRAEKIRAEIKGLERLIKTEKNAEAKEEFRTEVQALKIQLEAVPVERKQLQTVAKSLEHVLAFTGEKELNLNDEFGAKDNALVFKLRLAQLTPFLDGVELGDIRILKDIKDGHGENYFQIEVNADLEKPLPKISEHEPADRSPSNSKPAIILKIRQALFESKAVLEAEKKSMPAKLSDLDLQFKDDGLHISGKWKTFFWNVPFDMTVDFVSKEVDVFDVKVRKVDVGGLDLEFLAKYALEMVQKRLELMFKDRCKFEYVGTEKDQSRTLRVTADPAKLVPAFPDLHLLEVDIRERVFLMKIGKP